MEAPSPAPASSPALLECRLCDLVFDTHEKKRQHAKSEWHVYKIRCRVAEPETSVTPSGSESKPSARRPKVSKPISELPYADEESGNENSESDKSTEAKVVEFAAEECLFCNKTSKDFDENLSHMHQAHSLVIPFQSSLVVDLQTLIWFLHMVIFGYHECICCGKRRRTLEAVQQHMTSMGHCRFEVTEEISGFYDMTSLGEQSTDTRKHPDDHTLRLPSGKLLTHRSSAEHTSRSWRQEKSPAGPSALPASQQNTPEPQGVDNNDRKEQALTKQLAHLRIGDQMSLMHLQESQQRVLLVARRKGLDEAKRAERRKRSRLEMTGNKLAIHANYYKQEVPVYMGG